MKVKVRAETTIDVEPNDYPEGSTTEDILEEVRTDALVHLVEADNQDICHITTELLNGS